MKKNMMMRLASFLLVAVLISTSAISGTYAKYVTSDSADDTARVAKWGVTVIAGGNLFGKNYVPHGETNEDEISASALYSVDTSNGDKIVAPGTKSAKGMVVSVKGTPEVENVITVTTAAGANKDIFLAAGSYGVMVPVTGVVTAENYSSYYYKNGDNFVKATAADKAPYYELHDFGAVAETVSGSGKYLPLAWSVKKATGSTGTLGDISFRTVADMYDALAAEFTNTAVAGETTNRANATLNDDYSISWEWAFEGQSNIGDTILGNLQANVAENVVVKLTDVADTFTAVEASDYSLNVGFDITIAVTQVN